MIGRVLGHYTVVELIGAGGMGVVYRARDERLERDVALKVLPAGSLGDEQARRRFRKEALALAKLNHPHIGAVYDFDSHDGLDFLVMEYVAGTTLVDRLGRSKIPERDILTPWAPCCTRCPRASARFRRHRSLNSSTPS